MLKVSTLDSIPCRSHPGRRERGFTLAEMLVVIGIVAILTSIGVPSYRSVTNSNRVASELNGLLGDMQFARAEAIKQGRTVTVCSSTDGLSCAAANTWQTGWIVFSDSNANRVVNANEPILRYQKAFPSGDTFIASSSTSAVSFNREGFAFGSPTVTFTLHDSTSNSVWTRCLEITLVGMMTSEKAGTGACS